MNRVAVYSVHGRFLYDWRLRKINSLLRQDQADWIKPGISVKLREETPAELQWRIARATQTDGTRIMSGWHGQQPHGRVSNGVVYKSMCLDAVMVLS